MHRQITEGVDRRRSERERCLASFLAPCHTEKRAIVELADIGRRVGPDRRDDFEVDEVLRQILDGEIAPPLELRADDLHPLPRRRRRHPVSLDGEGHGGELLRPAPDLAAAGDRRVIVEVEMRAVNPSLAVVLDGYTQAVFQIIKLERLDRMHVAEPHHHDPVRIGHQRRRHESLHHLRIAAEREHEEAAVAVAPRRRRIGRAHGRHRIRERGKVGCDRDRSQGEEWSQQEAPMRVFHGMEGPEQEVAQGHRRLRMEMTTGT